MLNRNQENPCINILEDIKEKIIEFENMGIKKMVIALEKTELEDPLAVFSKEVM